MLFVDVMGGDNAPNACVEATFKFATTHPDVAVHCFACQDVKLPAALPGNVHWHVAQAHAERFTAPVEVLRQGRDTSLWLLMEMLLQNPGVGVSAGSTSVLLILAKHILGMSGQRLKRPALLSHIPNEHHRLYAADLGANLVMDADQLVALAEYCVAVLGENTRVKLLNVGQEPYKGTPILRLAWEKLKAHPGIDFDGFVEPHMLFDGRQDLVLTDGMLGNIMLKSFEGAFSYTAKGLLRKLKTSLLGRLHLWLQKDMIQRFINPHAQHQAAHLVGLQRPFFKVHGRANQQAFYCALSQALAHLHSQQSVLATE